MAQQKEGTGPIGWCLQNCHTKLGLPPPHFLVPGGGNINLVQDAFISGLCQWQPHQIITNHNSNCYLIRPSPQPLTLLNKVLTGREEDPTEVAQLLWSVPCLGVSFYSTLPLYWIFMSLSFHLTNLSSPCTKYCGIVIWRNRFFPFLFLSILKQSVSTALLTHNHSPSPSIHPPITKHTNIDREWLQRIYMMHCFGQKQEKLVVITKEE